MSVQAYDGGNLDVIPLTSRDVKTNGAGVVGGVANGGGRSTLASELTNDADVTSRPLGPIKSTTSASMNTSGRGSRAGSNAGTGHGPGHGGLSSGSTRGSAGGAYGAGSQTSGGVRAASGYPQTPVGIPRRRRPSVDDFATVDWIQASSREHAEVTTTRQLKKGLVFRLAYALQDWLLYTVLGLAVGVIAGTMSLGVEWLSDLKFGYCSVGLFLNRSLCCRDIPDTVSCDAWIEWVQAFGQQKNSDPAWFVNSALSVFVSTILALLCAWLASVYSKYASGSGIPEVKVILGGFNIRNVLGFWTLAVKMCGLVLVVSSGLSVGKAGPLVHLACACASILSKAFPKFRNQGKQREALSAASAAGIASAFGAPIGGILFSLEEVSSYFPHRTMWRAFFCAIISTLALQFMDPFHTGKLVQFQVKFRHSWRWFELVPFCMLGILGGLVGALFIRVNLFVCRVRRHSKWFRRHQVAEVVYTAIICALLSTLNPFLRGNNNALLLQLFSECDPTEPSLLCNSQQGIQALYLLLIAGVAKLVFTMVTFGQRIPAGAFIPMLAVGACFGRMTGIAFKILYEQYHDSAFFYECATSSHCVNPGVYALIGAASTLGGLTRMTVCLVVIMIELTGGLNFVLPIMLAVICAKWVGDAFGHGGIFVEHIRQKGYPYLNHKDERTFSAVASDVMAFTDLHAITLRNNTLASLERQLGSSSFQGFPVVTDMDEMLIVGYISRRQLGRAIQLAQKNPGVTPSSPCVFSAAEWAPGPGAHVIDLRSYLDSTPIQVVEKTPLNVVYEMFKQLGLRYCLVTRHGRLVGIIKKKDVLHFMSRMTAEQAALERLGSNGGHADNDDI